LELIVSDYLKLNMSVSPLSRSITESKSIPTRRMLLTDPSQLPSDYSSTPGGSLYSTTPGGTRIIYDRSFLMNMRQSPLAQTPPKCQIPHGLLRGTPQTPVGNTVHNAANNHVSHVTDTIDESPEQFHMDM
jgi:translation initiation factor 4E binding protein 2